MPHSYLHPKGEKRAGSPSLGSLESRRETVLVCPGFIGRSNHRAVKAMLSGRLVKGIHSLLLLGTSGASWGTPQSYLSQRARLLESLFISFHHGWKAMVEGYLQGLRGSRGPRRSSGASSWKLLGWHAQRWGY